MDEVDSPTPHQRGNLMEVAADHLRSQITAGVLRPGEKIDQDEVASVLGVSRLPVREAIIRLQSEGLVKGVPRRGALVQRLTPDDIHDAYALYGSASAIAAERAARVAEPSDIERLQGLARRMDEETDPRELDRLNHALHRKINTVGGSTRLRAVLRMLSAGLSSSYFFDDPAWVRQARKDHDVIIRAIADGDPDAAKASMESHLDAIGDHAVRELQQRGFWDGSQTS